MNSSKRLKVLLEACQTAEVWHHVCHTYACVFYLLIGIYSRNKWFCACLCCHCCYNLFLFTYTFIKIQKKKKKKKKKIIAMTAQTSTKPPISQINTYVKYACTVPPRFNARFGSWKPRVMQVSRYSSQIFPL